MKAAVCPSYGPPEVLQVKQVGKPRPSRRELLVRVRAADVTVTDSRMRSGVPQAPLWFQAALRISVGFKGPRGGILGFAVAGTVDEVGAGATGFNVGDQVYAFNGMKLGGFAEYVRVRADKIVARVPAGLTLEEAAAIPYGGLLAWCFLKKVAIRPGDEVLVYGASGSTGVAGVQIARALGARVTGVCSGRNLELVASLGAESVIDYTKENSVGPRRFDVVFDAAGRRKTSPLKESLSAALKPGGRSVSVDGGLPFGLNRDAFLALSELVAAGKVKPVIDRRYPLEEIADAFRYMEKGHKRGSVLVIPSPSFVGINSARDLHSKAMRRCNSSDHPRVLEIINAAAEAYRGVIPADRWHEPYMSSAQLESDIAAGIEFWGCWKGDDLVGVMGIQPVKAVALVRHAYVRPGLQREGVGTMLINHLLATTKGQILVGTWAAATWAIAFYERNGFTLISRDRTPQLLREYWSIPERQIETSVVLARPAL